MMNHIYLDHAATTPLSAEVIEAVNAAAAEAFANPGSQHAPGRAARRRLEDAKDQIASLLAARTSGVHADRVIVTSGGTESNNLLLAGLTHGRSGRVVISAVEHPSVGEYAKALARRGYDVQRAGVDRYCRLDLDHFHSLITPETLVASVMLGNNETGAIQPVAEAAEICASAGVPLHTDASQAAGKIPVDFTQLGVAAMTVSPHKLHGPRGIGLLLLRHDLELEPMLHGGFQQLGFRPGTEPTAMVVGALKSIELANQWVAEVEGSKPPAGDRVQGRGLRPADSTPATPSHNISTLRDRFEQQLLAEVSEIQINASAAERLPHISNVAFPGLDRQALLMALDLAGVACSTGSACASGSSQPSPTLLAMGLEKPLVDSSLRFSFAATTTPAEIDLAVGRISNAVNKLRSS